MRRATWVFPCLAACTSATPPTDRIAQEESVESPVEQPPAAAPGCEPGLTRPCYAGPEATAGVGRCKAGVETCDGRSAAWSACVGAVMPAAAEDCATPDDDDCDGRSDDCAETKVALSTAFTSDRELWLEDWGGGLGIVGGALFWVVEPGGRVVDVFEGGGSEPSPSWEFEEEVEEAMTAEIGGAWPGALLRSYQTASTRAGYVIEQERWGGRTFADVENSDDHLQWSHEMPIPWRGGHAIALQQWTSSYEMMEALDDSTLEFGGIEAAEQRRLQRKVDRLLARAKPRLVIVAAEEVEPWEEGWGLFEVENEAEDEGEDEGEDEDGPEAEEATDVAVPAGAVTEAPTAAPPEAKAPALPRPPPLPEVPRSFVALSDGTVVILAGTTLWSWKPRQRGWAPIELPTATDHSGARLRAGLDRELLLSECTAGSSLGRLWRHDGSSWSAVPLPTPACLQAIAMTPDRTRWLVSGNQLWQRKLGDAEPWARVPVPAPWQPYQVAVFDGLVWIVAEDAGVKSAEDEAVGVRSAVFVNRPVPKPRVLPTEETVE